jgi:hypothetical protein
MKEDLIEYQNQLTRLLLFVDLPKQVGLGAKSVKENYIQPYYDSTSLDKEIRISMLKDKILNLRKELGMSMDLEFFVQYNNSTYPKNQDDVIKHLADKIVANSNNNTLLNNTMNNSTVNIGNNQGLLTRNNNNENNKTSNIIKSIKNQPGLVTNNEIRPSSNSQIKEHSKFLQTNQPNLKKLMIS